MSRLKFGMWMFPVHRPHHDPTLQFERDLQLAEHADSLGFSEFWFGEHHSGGWQIIADPLLMMAAAASRTKQIKLGSGVSTLPLHHPKMLLDSVIQLDHMTRGRVMFGVGSGSLVLDSTMMGLDPMKARAATEESLEAMLMLLADDGPVTYQPENADWTLNEASLQLLPYSDPLDIRTAVFNSASGPRLAGRFDLGMLSFGASAAVGLGKENRMALAIEKAQYKADEYGNTVDRSRWTVSSPIHLAETEELARQQVRQGIHHYIDYIRQILPLNVPTDSDVDNIIDTLHLAGQCVVGTPEMAIDHIERMQELSGGFGTFCIEHADWASHDDTKRSMELFAQSVVPHFTGSNRSRLAAYDRELGADHDQLTRRTLAKAQTKADLSHSMEVKKRRQEAALTAKRAAEPILDLRDEAADDGGSSDLGAALLASFGFDEPSVLDP